MPQLASSAKRGRSTAAWHVYFTPSCTGWTSLSGSSTNSGWLFTVHRCMQRKAPQYLVDCCMPSSDIIASHQRLRSASRRQLYMPHQRSKFGRWAFSVAGPVVCNSLSPAHLRDPSLSSDSSKTALKTHLFTECQCHIKHIVALYNFTFDIDIWHVIWGQRIFYLHKLC